MPFICNKSKFVTLYGINPQFSFICNTYTLVRLDTTNPHLPFMCNKSNLFLKCLVVVYFLSYPQNGVMRKMSLVTWLTYRSMWSIFWCFCFFFPSDFVMETDMQMLDSSLSYISYSASLLLYLCQVLVQHTRNTRISAGVCLELRQVSFFIAFSTSSFNKTNLPYFINV